MKQKILSLLVLLLTAASGAWADELPLVTITFSYSGPVYSESGIVTVTGSNADCQSNGGKYSWTPSGTSNLMSATVEPAAGYNITKVVFWSNDNGNYVNDLEDTAEPYVCYSQYSYGKSLSNDLSNTVDGYNIAKIEVYGSAEPVEPATYTEPVAISQLHVGDILYTGFSLTSTNPNGAAVSVDGGRGKCNGEIGAYGYGFYLNKITEYGPNVSITADGDTYIPVDENGNDGNAWVVTSVGTSILTGMEIVNLAGVTIEPPLMVEWNAETNTGTFNMPASDVVLTPRYAAATIFDADETEKQAYETLMEAIANVQDGDVIKLDWDVTSDGDIETPDADVNNPVHFTLDLNGHSINIDEFFVNNYVVTFTDSSEGQTGRVKCESFMGTGDACAYYFDSGTYFFHGDAAYYNDFFSHPEYRFFLTEGKEFVDAQEVEDGFYLRVDWKTYELTIGAGRFDTFYDTQNVTLDAETPAGVGLYTISSINTDRSEATVVALADPIAAAGTPFLVYNGTNNKLTVKLKVTPTNPSNSQMHAAAFQGTAVAKTFTVDDMAAYDYYALSGGKIFVPVYDAGILGKNQCWLEFLKSAGDTGGNAPARGITLVFEESETTEITTTDVTDETDGAWYDLSGRKLDGEPTTKGVYVKDGKKVVVK